MKRVLLFNFSIDVKASENDNFMRKSWLINNIKTMWKAWPACIEGT